MTMNTQTTTEAEKTALAQIVAKQIAENEAAAKAEAAKAAEDARRAELKARETEIRAELTDTTRPQALAAAIRDAMVALQKVHASFTAEQKHRDELEHELGRIGGQLGATHIGSVRALLTEVRPHFQKLYATPQEVRALRDHVRLVDDLTDGAGSVR